MKTRPFVTANFALTWDARISTRKGTPANFSSPRDKRRLLEIRATADAILAGARTVSVDNMSMGLPDEALRAERGRRGQAPYPVRVVLTNSGRLRPDLRVFAQDFSPVVIFSTTRMPRAVQAALAPKADLWLHETESVNLAAMLATLRAEYGVKRLVCEGGAQVFRSLLEADLVDELHTTLCPRLFGGLKAPTLTGGVGDFLPASTSLRLAEWRVEGGECFARYRVQR